MFLEERDYFTQPVPPDECTSWAQCWSRVVTDERPN